MYNMTSVLNFCAVLSIDTTTYTTYTGSKLHTTLLTSFPIMELLISIIQKLADNKPYCLRRKV